MPPQLHGRATGLFLVALACSLPTSVAAQSSTPIRTPVPPARFADSVDRALVVTLAAANRDGIANARAVLPRLTNEEVKRFAQRLIDDHQANLTATTVIAARLGYPPSGTTPLAAASGIATDTAFLDAEIAWHQKLLAELPASGVLVKDEELRLHLVETRQAALTHLEEAKRLRAKPAEPAP